MSIIFSPFIKEILEYATSIAHLYRHAEVMPAHFLLALLKHHKNNYATDYIESKIHLIEWKTTLLTMLKNLPASVQEPILSDAMERVIKNAYTEAQYFEAEVILPEYFFLAILNEEPFDGLSYQEARAFVGEKQILLQHQHQEMNWTKQDALFQLLKKLDNHYTSNKTRLKPYLHQAYHNTKQIIRSFILLIDEVTKANKITIEIIESIEIKEAIEQTLRFVAHRKYPLEEAFLYHYDTQEWTKIKITYKDILVETQNTSYSENLGADLSKMAY